MPIAPMSSSFLVKRHMPYKSASVIMLAKMLATNVSTKIAAFLLGGRMIPRNKAMGN